MNHTAIKHRLSKVFIKSHLAHEYHSKTHPQTLANLSYFKEKN